MKALPAYPFLYQINTRVWLTELSRALDRLGGALGDGRVNIETPRAAVSSRGRQRPGRPVGKVAFTRQHA